MTLSIRLIKRIDRISCAALLCAALLAGGCSSDQSTTPSGPSELSGISGDTSIAPVSDVDTAGDLAATSTNVELPRVYLDTRYVTPTGKTIRVSDATSFKSALTSAARGDVIELAAGVTFKGNFTLPAKLGTGWITIRSSGTLPAEGSRVSPSTAAGFAKIATTNSEPALATASSGTASYYRLMGVEVLSTASLTYALVFLGDLAGSTTSTANLAGNIILDRVYVHGNSTQALRRCVVLNSRASAVIDSYLSNCHEDNSDAQAILGFNGPGPFKITNNYLEGSTENILFGGVDPKITNLVPSDIEIRRNYIFKPLSWKGAWTNKNLVELKNAQRVLFEGNVLENNWYDGQTGFAVVLKSSNQSGRCNWCVTRDITWRYNKIINSPGGFSISARQALNGGTVVPAQRMRFIHNVFQNVGLSSQSGDRRLFQLLHDLTYITIAHNTGFSEDRFLQFDGSKVNPTYFVFRNNVMRRGRYGVIGTNTREGSYTLNFYVPDAVFQRNVIFDGATASAYPTDNYFPAQIGSVGFQNYSTGDYRLSSASAYRGKATDGTDPGADIARLDAATAGVRR